MRAIEVTLNSSNTSPATASVAAEMSLCPDQLTDLMFRVGSHVECHTLHNEVITGEVLAFEYPCKILVLKSPASSGQDNLFNVTCVNLELCSNIKVLKEVPESNTPKLPEINIQKVDERRERGTSERFYLHEAHKSDYGTDGIFLYFSLIKTIGPSGVSIEKDNTSNQQIIVIGKNIQIKPPYRADCISVLTKVNMADDSLNYAKKLVEKFWRDQNKDPYTLAPLNDCSGTSTNPSTDTSTSVSSKVKNVPPP